MPIAAVSTSRVLRRVGASRTDAWFAAFAAIGAFWLVENVLAEISLVLEWMGVFHRESGPPRFEPTLLPAALAGAFIAVRLGGWRAFLGLLAFAAVPFIRSLAYLIGAAIDCSHGNTDVCRSATDFDSVIPQAWLLPGFVAGVLAARTTRAHVPLRVELEALAPIALAPLVGYVLPSMRGIPGPSAFDVVVTLLGLLAASYILARRSSDPMRAALVVAGALLLLAILLISYELWFNNLPERDLLDQWLSVAGPFVLVIATYALARWPRAS